MDSKKKDKYEKEYICRFNFPFEFNGFKPTFDNNMLESIEPDIKDPDEPLDNPMIHGASYVGNDETLYLLRNHPNINNYIIEILLLWGANVDQKCITSYEKVVQYLLKYVLKPEKQSEYFANLAKVISKKIEAVTADFVN